MCRKKVAVVNIHWQLENLRLTMHLSISPAHKANEEGPGANCEQ